MFNGINQAASSTLPYYSNQGIDVEEINNLSEQFYMDMDLPTNDGFNYFLVSYFNGLILTIINKIISLNSLLFKAIIDGLKYINKTANNV